MKELNFREKSALIFMIVEDIKDKRLIYQLSRPNDDLKKLKDPDSSIYRWHNSDPVKKFVADYTAIVEDRKRRLIEEEIQRFILSQEQEGNEEGKKQIYNFDGNIDFTDRTKFLQYLNSQVNSIEDSKQKTDYLKMIADLLRFKDETGKNNDDIQRFYTPVTCYNCELYKQMKIK